jgi:hypothetical protein
MSKQARLQSQIIHKLCYAARQSISASFSEGIQPSSEAKTARSTIHGYAWAVQVAPILCLAALAIVIYE